MSRENIIANFLNYILFKLKYSNFHNITEIISNEDYPKNLK